MQNEFVIMDRVGIESSYSLKYEQTEHLYIFPHLMSFIQTEETGAFIGGDKFGLTEMVVTHFVMLVGGGIFRGGAEGYRMIGEKLNLSTHTVQKTLQKLQKIKLNIGKKPQSLLKKIKTHRSSEFAKKYGYTPEPCTFQVSSWYYDEYEKFEHRYKEYQANKLKYSPVTKIQYIPAVAKELCLSVKQYIILESFSFRYASGSCYNKSDWARVGHVSRQTIYNLLNKFLGLGLIKDFVLSRTGKRTTEELMIKCTNVFKNLKSLFFTKQKEKKAVERVEKEKVEPVKLKNYHTNPTKIEEDSSEATVSENPPIQSEEERLHEQILHKMASKLGQSFEYFVKYEASKFSKSFEIIAKLPLPKLQIVDFDEVLSDTDKLTKMKVQPHNPRFMSQFAQELHGLLEQIE